MILVLDEAAYARVRATLLAPRSDDLIALMVAASMGGATDFARPDTVALATELGWLQTGNRRPTGLGYLVSDSLREYTFWLGRDRKLPCEGRIAHLSADYFSGKTMLEIGCGAGCNLMSLGTRPAKVIGLEPEALYPQLGRILCEREGIYAPTIEIGSGERIPCADASFDVVLCVSSHQYMDLHTSLAEMVRVLRPGGELLIVGGTLATFVRVGLAPVLRGSWRALKPYGITIANTLSYQFTGRRLMHDRASGTTAFPIYPTRNYMERLLLTYGLVTAREPVGVDPETSFSFRKPA